MWLAGLHSVCMESTLQRPSSSLPVSGECKTCLLWIFPRLLQSLFMMCCCLPQAQHQQAPHLSSVMAAGTPLQAASLTSSCPPPMAFIHQQTVSYDATLLHSPSCMRSWPPHGAFPSKKWNVYMWETSLQSFSVPCSAASERTNKSFVSPLSYINNAATQETFQITRYDQHIVTTLRSCVSLSKWFLVIWSNMVPVSSWSSSFILNMRASWAFKTLVLTDQRSTNIPKHFSFQQLHCQNLKSAIHIPFDSFETLIAQVAYHFRCCNLLQMRGKCMQNWHKTLYSKSIFHSVVHKKLCSPNSSQVLYFYGLFRKLSQCLHQNASMTKYHKIWKKKSKKLHTASHQRVAEQFHISDHFIYH